MEENVLRINQMLLSQDKEMRILGREALKCIPSIKDQWGKMLLYFNSGLLTQGKALFFREKKTLRNYDRLLEMFEKYGYTHYVDYTLGEIELYYKNTKKLTELLREDTRLAEFRKRTQPINHRHSWFDDSD